MKEEDRGDHFVGTFVLDCGSMPWRLYGWHRKNAWVPNDFEATVIPEGLEGPDFTNAGHRILRIRENDDSTLTGLTDFVYDSLVPDHDKPHTNPPHWIRDFEVKAPWSRPYVRTKGDGYDLVHAINLNNPECPGCFEI